MCTAHLSSNNTVDAWDGVAEEKTVLSSAVTQLEKEEKESAEVKHSPVHRYFQIEFDIV